MNRQSTKFRLIRAAIDLTVGAATLSAVSAIVKNNVAEPESKSQKLTVGISSFVLGTMVAEKATNWVDRQLMGAVNGIEEANNKIAESTTDQQ